MESISAKLRYDKLIHELQELLAKHKKESYNLLRKLSARHEKEIVELIKKYSESWQKSDDKWRKNMALYCIVSAIAGIVVGVGAGYFIWGKKKNSAEPQTEFTQKQLMRKEMEASLPSKEDALKVMELIECLYEIDQVE